MPRIRKRTTSRGLVPPAVYARACSEVNLGSSVRQAALANNISHVTLSRFLKRRAEEGKEVARPPGYNPHNRVFTTEQEGKVRDYLKRAAAIYFGLTPTEVSVGKRLTGLHRHTCMLCIYFKK